MRCRRPDPRGFTMIEVLVSIVVSSVLLIGLYTLLDNSNHLAKQETSVADAQAASRSGIYEVARLIRQARVGQLYYGNSILPYVDPGTQKIVNNATGNETLTDLAGTTHHVRAGTDAIEVRGVLFDQVYFLDAGDISGSPSALQVTVPAVSAMNVQNFPATGKPAFASRNTKFLFVVATSETGPVPAGSNQYLNPIYYVGLVDATQANWLTVTSVGSNATATFTMDTTAAVAQKFYPQAGGMGTGQLERPFCGGPLDDVVFYVDRGAADPGVTPTQYTHPYLAEAALDGTSSGLTNAIYNIEPLVDETEDLQIAYGVDGADGSAPDRGVDPGVLNVASGGGDKDEWVYSNPADTPLTVTNATTVPVVNSFLDQSIVTGGMAAATLRSVMLALVVKASDPEVGSPQDLATLPGGNGYVLFDAPRTATGPTYSVSAQTGRIYRRRVQSMAVNLRNYL